MTSSSSSPISNNEAISMMMLLDVRELANRIMRNEFPALFQNFVFVC